ncbi:MAG: precorrin-6A reductase [Desulfotomaculum sp.]|nr:precorrin-6A reductase [Desulfotomaculum sp.]
MILVLAGTTEGRQLSAALQKKGYPVLSSAATEYGADLLRQAGVKQVICGRLEGEMWRDLITGRNVKAVVDATHPFAVEVSRQAIKACALLKIPYIRLERPPVSLPEHELIHKAANLEGAVNLAFSMGGVCFCTLGSKYMEYIINEAVKRNVKVVARVLPEPAVIEKCLQLGVEKNCLIAMQGPASREINYALYKFYKPAVILTKESGICGGLMEKIEPALELKIPVVIWQRPRINYPVKLASIEDVCSEIEKITSRER